MNVWNVLQDCVGGIMFVCVCGENFFANLAHLRHQISRVFKKQLDCSFFHHWLYDRISKWRWQNDQMSEGWKLLKWLKWPNDQMIEMTKMTIMIGKMTEMTKCLQNDRNDHFYGSFQHRFYDIFFRILSENHPIMNTP